MAITGLDRFDLALLRKCNANKYAFTKTDAQERRASDLERAGYLERKWDTYSSTAGGASIQQRWAYRLSAKGASAVAVADIPRSHTRRLAAWQAIIAKAEADYTKEQQ